MEMRLTTEPWNAKSIVDGSTDHFCLVAIGKALTSSRID